MIDIISVTTDIGLLDTQVAKAKNILNVQEGSLDYAPDIGIDLEYFLSPDFQFQNESFKSYLIERLANSGINVSSVIETVQSVFTSLQIYVSAQESSQGLVR